MTMLDWPYEGAIHPETIASTKAGNLSLPGNSVTDAHGNPSIAQLKIFSDGNHHMALEEACRRFLELHPEIQDVFYTTAPAGVVKDAFESGILRFGNLSISVTPNVFIGPPKVVNPLYDAGKITKPRAFAQSQGSVLLIKKGNPCNISYSSAISDLLRDDVRVACSSPTNEKASFGVYSETLCNLARSEGGETMADAMLQRLLNSHSDCDDDSNNSSKLDSIHSGRVHHREIPQLIASGLADVAPVYHHLALRYKTIFPDKFDFIPLGGTVSDPRPGPEHKLNTYYVSVVKETGGDWGDMFAEFMASSEAVADIYREKGMTSLIESMNDDEKKHNR